MALAFSTMVSAAYEPITMLRDQWRMAKYLRPVWFICDMSARALGREELTGWKNTRRCYEHFFDPLCADTGVWPDYTEGFYESGEESYEEAKLKQFDRILDRTGTASGMRVLDVGCGNGCLMHHAQERGCDAVGITVARTQAERCRAEGLTVHVATFDEIPDLFETESFDVVFLNGCTEHLVTVEDRLAGRHDAVRRALLRKCRHVLRPGGRLWIACIHFRGREPDPVAGAAHPLEHAVGSEDFQRATLVKIYSGWYPVEGDFPRIAAELGLSLEWELDNTNDYYVTSQRWSTRLKEYVRANRDFTRAFLMRFFRQDPRYFYMAMLFWYYDPWTWQFRGGDKSPMSNRLLVFRREA